MAIVALLALASPVAAHDEPLRPEELWSAWVTDPWAAAVLAGVALVYVSGTARVWHRAGIWRGVRRWQAGCFAGGLAVLALALLSPLHPLGGSLFSAHMTQHVLIMVVAAPLLVLGSSGVAGLWALPAAGRRAAGRVVRAPAVRRAWRFLTAPAVAWTIHAVVLWGWHAPPLFGATVHSDRIHAAQHASFLLVSLLFWWVVVRTPGGRRAAAGLAVVFLFTTAVHVTLLSALLTFSQTAWYPAYGNRGAVWGLSPVADQQLGGLIMWVPGGFPYVAAALALFARWMGRTDGGTGWRAASPRAKRDPAGLIPPRTPRSAGSISD